MHKSAFKLSIKHEDEGEERGRKRGETDRAATSGK
jgi:hypothetical protein